MQIDEAVYRSAGEVVLDEQLARDAAVLYLDAEDGLDYVVNVLPDRVEVAVSRQATTGFLRVIGIDGIEVSASASAEPATASRARAREGVYGRGMDCW